LDRTTITANNCPNPSNYAGRSLCDFAGGYCGECVSFYKVCSGDRRVTGQWVKGQKVRGASLAVGTGIATFPNGKYFGHAAIYMGQDSGGIQVWDQWKGHPVSRRTIRWNGNGISNNGDSFYVIAGGSGSSSAPSSPSTPSAPAGDRCGAVRGRCINTNTENCNGQIRTGLCPGAANIRCCAPRASAMAEDIFSEEFAESVGANDATTPTSSTLSPSSATAVVGVVGGIIIVMLIAVIVVLTKKINN